MNATERPFFHDLPHDRRMALREAIENAGGAVMSYQGPGVQVACPTDYASFSSSMREAGLELHEPSFHYFPLGTDKPAMHLRHGMAKYGNTPSFWLFGVYIPTENAGT